jgi:polyisoprenoid-binding protein YceI
MAVSCGARRTYRCFLLVWFSVSAAAASAAEPFSLVIDKEKSRVYARVDAVRVGHDHGIEGRLVEGALLPGGAGKLVFDMASFTCDTPAARKHVGLTGSVSPADRRKTTSNMLSEYVLDAGAYSHATYSAEKMQPLDGQAAGEPGRYELTGKFTLHGVTRPLSFSATLARIEGSDDVRIHGTFAILQTDYGITPYSALGGIAKVANQIQIWGELRARAAK